MCFIGPMPQVSTEEYSVPVVLLMHLGSSAPQVHIAVFMCVTSLCLCVVLYSLVAVCGTLLVCVGMCVVLHSLVSGSVTRAFHNHQTAPFYAHSHEPAAFDNAGKTRKNNANDNTCKIDPFSAQSAMWSSY